MTYQPLPKELYIRRSTIEGMGLFAKEDIEYLGDIKFVC